MNVIPVIKILNKLKQQHKLKDYAIFGAVASTYYMEPVYTDDIDILVLAELDSEYSKIWNALKEHATKVKSFGFIISDTEVQILPTLISPLYHDAVLKAKRIKVDGTIVKVVDKEHLILLAMMANRGKDRFRASVLLQTANIKYLNTLLKEFDKNGELKKRLSSLS